MEEDDDESESESGTDTSIEIKPINGLKAAIERLKRKNSLPEGWGVDLPKLSEKTRKKSLEKGRERKKSVSTVSNNGSYDDLDKGVGRERKKSMVKISIKDGNANEIDEYRKSSITPVQIVVVDSNPILNAKNLLNSQRKTSAR